MPLHNLSSFAQSAHTLPRNFTFHYQDGESPKTPEPLERSMPHRTSPPPAPPGRALREAPYRLRVSARRRGPPVQAAKRAIRAIHCEISDPFSNDQDQPLPSIEVTDSTGFPANLQPRLRSWSPPKTPVAQIYEKEQTPEAFSSQEDLTRPSTACSGFSDSSKASSVESFPSFGASASPKSEADPFAVTFSNFDLMLSPLPALAPITTGRKVQKSAFTRDMDEHLWLTYNRYLQDPTHTPFKMLPGTAPPPGVCSRVVREAKRTWRGQATSAIPRVYRFARWGSNCKQLGEDIASAQVGNSDRRSFLPWPRSDSATRKRLRDLCKLAPTLSAHYGRLLHARSPSPFMSTSPNRPTSVVHDIGTALATTAAFKTRDMNISLATSVSTTMQPGHPINQLSSDAPIENTAPGVFEQPHENITPRPRAVTHKELHIAPRTPGHTKSLSVHEGSSQTNFRPLASPFRPVPMTSQNSQPLRCHNFLQTAVAATPAGPSLAAPVELHAPVPRRSFFKRPAQNQLNDMLNSEDPYTRQNHLMRELFGPAQPIEISHRRVRSRGFSLGDMTASSRLESLFAETSQEHAVTSESLPQSTHARSNSLLPPPSIDRVLRLGSPFAEKPATKTHFNTFPRNFSLIGLEPAMEISEPEPMPTDEHTVRFTEQS